MEMGRLSSQLLVSCLLLALLAGCAMGAPESPTPEPAAVPIAPTATRGPSSCGEVEDVCMELSFDGEKNCTYSGPSDVKTGPVTLIFLNESGGRAAVELFRHLGDQTIQDMIDSIGEEPATEKGPMWANPVNTWQIIGSGEIYSWTGDLKPGVHTMVCASLQHGVWFGGGFTVED